MDVYLSRLYLNALHRAVRACLGDCYRMHQQIMTAFPASSSRDPECLNSGVLYRVETVGDSAITLRLLIQSAAPPDWALFPQTWLQPLGNEINPSVRPVGAVYERVCTGMSFIFRLRANPTKRLGKSAVDRGDPLAGKRIALLREEDQLSWLARKGEQHGFHILRASLDSDVPAVQVARQEVSRGWRRDENNAAKRLTFGAVVFNGLLEVTDGICFRSALMKGIGSGKAFGFGLLSIAQAR